MENVGFLGTHISKLGFEHILSKLNFYIFHFYCPNFISDYVCCFSSFHYQFSTIHFHHFIFSFPLRSYASQSLDCNQPKFPTSSFILYLKYKIGLTLSFLRYLKDLKGMGNNVGNIYIFFYLFLFFTFITFSKDTKFFLAWFGQEVCYLEASFR